MMASEDDIELTQTQSQSHNTQDNYFTQNGEEDKDIWGRLMAKHHSFRSVGTFRYSKQFFRKINYF